MSRKLVLSITALLLIAAPAAAPRGHPARAQDAFEPVFEQSPCPFEIPLNATEGVDVVCGYVTVPEHHADPAGPTLRLATVIVKDRGAGHRDDPLFVLAGGPGEHLVQDAVPVALLFESFAGNRDLVIFDQRGAGLSEPALECPEFEQAALDALDEPDVETALSLPIDALLACRDRLVAEGRNLSAFNTVENAADVDAIRQALGYEQINLFGGSYGSRLAQAVMRAHPDHLRSVIIDSVLPVGSSFILNATTTAAAAILRLVATCEADAACNAAYPDLRQVLLDVIDRLNAEPVLVTVKNPTDGQSYEVLLRGDNVRQTLFVFLYQTPVIPVLPQAVYTLAQGDYALMTELAGLQLARYGSLSMGMELSIMCAEDAVGYTRQDVLDAWAELPTILITDLDPEVALEHSFFAVCEQWPVAPVDLAFKEPVVSDVPTLVLSGEFDPVTPPQYGRQVAEHLSHSYVYEFPGTGHSVSASNACAQSIARSFLYDPTRTPSDACIDTLTGVVFDLPSGPEAAITLEPVRYPQQDFEGVVPAGWTETAPHNYQRARNALDPTLLAQDRLPLSPTETLSLLRMQLAIDEPLDAAATEDHGLFTWDRYAFELRGYALDLAIAPDGSGGSYFVLTVSLEDEHALIYADVFLPALAAIAPLD